MRFALDEDGAGILIVGTDEELRDLGVTIDEAREAGEATAAVLSEEVVDLVVVRRISEADLERTLREIARERVEARRAARRLDRTRLRLEAARDALRRRRKRGG